MTDGTRPFGRRGFRRRLALSLAVLASLPLLVALWIINGAERDALLASASDRVAVAAELQAQSIERHFSRWFASTTEIDQQVTRVLARDGITGSTALAPVDTWGSTVDSVEALLSASLDQPDVLAAALVDPDLQPLVGAMGADPDTPLAVSAAVPADRAVLVWADGLGTSTPALYAASPITSSGRIVARVLVRFDLRSIGELTSGGSGMGETGDTWLLAPVGGELVLVTSPRDDSLRPGDEITEGDFRSRLVAASEGRTVTTAGVQDLTGREVVLATEPVAPFDWAVAVKIDEAEALAPLAGIRSTLLFVLVLAVLLVAPAVTVVARRISDPIHKLTEAVTAFRTDGRATRVDIEGDDEFAELADAFASMSTTIEQHRRELEATVAERTRQLVELTTELQGSNERLLVEATHDHLTGLANRARFERELERVLSGANRAGSSALLFGDLDGFKPINDRFGHDAGDEVLVVVANRIRACLRMEDIACRVGGDEFAMILQQRTPSDAGAVAERIVREVAAPIAIGDQTVSVGISLGQTLLDDQIGSSVDEVVRIADAAMYEQKQKRSALRATGSEDRSNV